MGKIFFSLIILSAFLPFSHAQAAVVSNAPRVSVQDGLVGWWTMDGKDMTATTAFDKSGNGRHGTLTNGPLKKAGKIGQAMRLDGTNDYIDLGDWQGGIFDGSSSKATFSVWIKPGNTAGGTFLGKYDTQVAPDQKTFVFDFTSGGQIRGLAYQTGDGTNSFGFTTTANHITNINKWYHVVSVFDLSAQSVAIYVDGLRVAATLSTAGTPPTVFDDTAKAIQIGQITGVAGATNFFTGLIDDVRIYNRILSANEVYQLYKETGGTILLDNPKRSTTSGLVGWWTMDAATISSTALLDQSGQGNHGTLNGPVKRIGKIGQALFFDGSNDYVRLPDNASLKNFSAYGIFLWIDPRTIVSEDVIFSNQEFAPDKGFQIRLESGKVRCEQANSSNEWVPALGNTTLSAASGWYHVGCVWDGTQLKVYVNGKLDQAVALTTYSAPNSADGAPVIAGKPNLEADRYVDGLLDDVRLYNRGFSDAEAYALYREMGGTYVSSSQTVANQGANNTLLAHWSFNGDQMNRTTVFDVSTSSRAHGTLTNEVRAKPGKIGQGLLFDGSDDLVSISAANQAAIGALRSGFTVSAWIRPNRISGTQRVIAHTRTSSANGFGFGLSGSSIQLTTFLVKDYDSSGITVVRDKWQHIAAVMGSDNAVTFYYNGNKYNTVTHDSSGNANTDDALQLGATTPQGSASLSELFNGTIDDVRIYYTPLTGNEIYSLYLSAK